MLNVFRMSPSGDHRPPFRPTRHISLGDGFPDLDGGEGERAAHLAGAPFNLQRIPDMRRRDESGVNVRRQARGGGPGRLDGQPARPVRQTQRHGAVQRALGVQMHGRDLQQGSDVARLGGHDLDLVEQDIVDRTVGLHLRPVLAHLCEHRGRGRRGRGGVDVRVHVLGFRGRRERGVRRGNGGRAAAAMNRSVTMKYDLKYLWKWDENNVPHLSQLRT